MPRFLIHALLAATVALVALPAQARLFDRSPEDIAAEADRVAMQDVSVWVDVTWGFRTAGAANKLNRAHQAFAARGYRVHSVQPYIENGDLQGFFVTYRKP